MLATKLVRLIESHSETLVRTLTKQILECDRTAGFRKIPAQELQLAAAEVYRNLGDWLLQKTEKDIAHRFRSIAGRRSAEGIPLDQMVWAITLSRETLWRFLRREAFADTVVALHAELEFEQLLNQFFDRALYYAVLGYEEAGRTTPKSELARARNLALAIGLISPPLPEETLADSE